uniref:hypothetical protein n=1 Tax=Bacteroides ovatus TaxID=28116 RepID=UPI001E626122
FRTEKLSLVTPMVLRNSGRVGSRRFLRSPLIHFESRGFLCFGTLVFIPPFLAGTNRIIVSSIEMLFLTN